jgi:hypothetical protein
MRPVMAGISFKPRCAGAAQLRQQRVGVFAQFRRGHAQRFRLRRRRHVDRLSHHAERAQHSMLDLARDPEVLDLLVVEGLVDAVDRPAGYAGLGQQVHHHLAGHAARDPGDGGV